MNSTNFRYINYSLYTRKTRKKDQNFIKQLALKSKYEIARAIVNDITRPLMSEVNQLPRKVARVLKK